MNTVALRHLAPAAVTVLVAGMVSLPAQAAGTSRYVALGDSYSAGTGTRAKVDSCYRSKLGHPVLVASASGWSLDYQACSGATIVDVQNKQVGALDATAQHVSVSAGGNDAGFSSVLTTCALPSWMGNCGQKLAQAQQAITGTIPGRLDTLYATIRSKAPAATAVAIGYPHLFNGTDCNLLTFFSADKQRQMNALTDQLDEVTRQRAGSHGLGFADPRATFAGHAVCDASAWVNGASLPIEESYHPNVTGNQAYASVIAPVLGGQAPRVVSAASTVRRPAPSAKDYASVAPGLASRTNLARARSAGIDTKALVRIDRDLRSGDLRRARAAFLELKRLDGQGSRTVRA